VLPSETLKKFNIVKYSYQKNQCDLQLQIIEDLMIESAGESKQQIKSKSTDIDHLYMTLGYEI